MSRFFECGLLIMLAVIICTVSIQAKVWSPLLLRKLIFNIKCQFTYNNILHLKISVAKNFNCEHK